MHRGEMGIHRTVGTVPMVAGFKHGRIPATCRAGPNFTFTPVAFRSQSTQGIAYFGKSRVIPVPPFSCCHYSKRVPGWQLLSKPAKLSVP